jgi:tetratricopeptide (TPR) repeat protein
LARIFISHTSANNDRAIQLRDWLVANGWNDFFLDLDPEQGIAPGEKWKEALKNAAYRCEAVLALVSPEWLARDWCRAELNTAELLGKKIFVLLIGSKSSDIASSLKDAQYVDLINDPDAYQRLKVGLQRAGLDPSSFPFDEERRPYPGFPPFEEKDAAIFFGRDAQIVRGLDALRRLARAGAERMLVILGASGCGKSSFLRAGLWPRLKRDDSAWLPLATIRPERAAISGKFGLVEALYRIMNEMPFAEKLQKQDLPRSRADIEKFVTTSDDGLLKILAALKQAGHMPGLSGKPPPTTFIPIDQGEELFNEEGRPEAKRFIDILSKTLAGDPAILALVTMRTDSFPQVQNDSVLAALPKDTFTLDKMLEGSYREIIEGPAALVKPTPIKIDPELTEALLQDAAGQDALALLAFTLRYLYDKYQADNELSLEGYEKLGRLKGVIETTVKQAIVEGVAKGELPKDEKAQLALIRIAFIPHLARVNPAGQFVRRIATRTEIPPEARPLIDRLAEARLLIKDRRTVGHEDAEVVEVAHEALLREWKSLDDSLFDEREFLVAKGQLEQDIAEYKKTPEGRRKGALLGGNKLARASEWLISRPQDLTAEERRFIQSSADVATARRRRSTIAFATAFIVIAGLAVAFSIAAKNATEGEQRAQHSFDTANNLLTNFVEVVSENLSRTAQLTTIESLVRNIQQTIEGLPANDNAQLIMQRARMSVVIAELKWKQGDTSGMHTNSIEAQKLIARLDLDADNDPEALHLLARSNALIAAFYDTNVPPDYKQARTFYEKARDQLRQLERRFDKSGPIGENWRWLRSLASVRFDFGDFILRNARDKEALEEADQSFRASEETFRKLKQLRPADVTIDYDLAWATNKSGDVLSLLGQFDAALDRYQNARDGITHVGEPYLWANLWWRYALAITHGNIGLSLRQQKKFQEAIDAFTTSATEVTKVVLRDPQQVDWREWFAWTQDEIGETKIMWAWTEQDPARLNGADADLDTAKVKLGELVQDAPGRARYLGDKEITLADIEALKGTIKEFAKDFSGAAVDFVNAEKFNPALEDERHEEMILRQVTFLKLAGLNYLKAGRQATGRKYLEQAWDIASNQTRTAIYPEPFSRVCSELKTHLDQIQP